MEKRHLYHLIAWENLYVAISTLAAGLLVGIALDKAMFLLVSRMVGGKIPLGFFLSKRAVVETVVLFLGIYAFIFLNALRQIKAASPIDLLHAENVGEKEPKAKWLIAIVGFMKIFDQKYVVKERLKSFPGNGIITANIANTQFIVMPNMEDIQELYKKQKEVFTDIAGNIRIYYGFDTHAGEEEQKEFQKAVYEVMAKHGYCGNVESSVEARQGFMGLYGGFFFIGIFWGLLFVMATVLIIYYKQISEGYDDKERFAIMQKVGMSKEEVKASIRSQVLTVFFLPLITAGIHVAAAFPMFNKILIIMNMENTEMYAVCTGICFLVFAAMYVVIYSVTARTYYRIVSK